MRSCPWGHCPRLVSIFSNQLSLYDIWPSYIADDHPADVSVPWSWSWPRSWQSLISHWDWLLGQGSIAFLSLEYAMGGGNISLWWVNRIFSSWLYNPDAATSDLAAYVLGLFLRRGSAYIILMLASDLFACVLGQHSWSLSQDGSLLLISMGTSWRGGRKECWLVWWGKYGLGQSRPHSLKFEESSKDTLGAVRRGKKVL